MKTLIITLLLISNIFAGSDNEVFIRGKISNTFNEKEVKIIDSLGQSYSIPVKYFPKDFKFQQGASFAVEVPEEELSKFKIKKN